MTLARNIFLLAIAGLLTALAGSAWWKHANAPEGPGERGPREAPVVVTPVEPSEFADRLEAVGTAGADESVVITAKVTESVSRIAFKEGMLVEEGEILIELTDAEEAAELEEARAALKQARQEHERVTDLVERGVATRSRLDTVLAARDQAKARMAAIEARLSDRLIRAPFSGLLGLRKVSVGTLVTPGTQITTLDDIDPIKLDFEVPETFLPALGAGQEVEARASAYPDRLFRGKITVVATRVDPATRSVPVRAEIGNEESLLRPGMLMTVEIINNRRTSLMVPEEAIVPLDTRVFVFRLRDGGGSVERVQISTGKRRPGEVEVLSGLKEGDMVVVRGTNLVRDGARVKVVERAAAGTPEPNRPPPQL
ncbi:MAG: efflux RND transporter periplasmic adaptor subunit [Alphaproteobacteria bacterium]